jgi:hypothetical protein
MPAAFKTCNEMHQLDFLLAEHLDGGIVEDVVNICGFVLKMTNVHVNDTYQQRRRSKYRNFHHAC